MTTTAASPRDLLLRFAAGELDDPVVVCPLFSEKLPARRIGADWTLSQSDPRMTEAKLQVGLDAGFPPVVKVEIGSLGFLTPREEVLEDDGHRRVVRVSYATDSGELVGVVERMANGSHAVEKMINSIDDTLKMAWVWEHLGDYDALGANLSRMVQQIGDRGLLCLNISHPFGSFDDQVTTIFFAHEHPAEMEEVTARMCEVRKRWIDIVTDAGVRCFFASALGSNMYSPEMVDRWMTPYAAELCEHVHRRGGIYYLHECGSMKHKLARGTYERIMPDWLEGFEAPPLGDIDSIAEARRMLPPQITLKGNLNLEFLERATAAEVEARTLAMLEELRGFRHIVGGACSLLGGTPDENLRAMVRAAARFLGHTP